MENATVYAPLHLFPEVEHLEALAPEAKIHHDPDPDVQEARMEWPGLTITLRRMPDMQMKEHIPQFEQYLRAQGANAALITRLFFTLSVYGLVIEPGFDEQERAMRFVAGLNGATDGLCFLDEEVYDAGGTPLLRDPAGGLHPPPPERVARRALILLALAMRGLLDQDAGTPDEPQAEEMRADLVTWLASDPDLQVETEDEELELLITPIGAADPQSIMNAVWRAEGAQVLLWALGARELPAHDAQEHPYEVAKAVGILGDAVSPLFDAPQLREIGELEQMQSKLLAIHWRLREHRAGDPFDFVAFAADNWFGGFDLEGIALAERDLAVGGAPLSQADPEHVELTRSISVERHLAANWVIGAHPFYSRIGTPT